MRQKFLILMSVVVIALNVARCPELLVHPRFFAEEGATYFANAFQTSFLANIFSASYGYYTLYNQLATSLAAQAPLEYAPLVTTLMSLIVQTGVSLYVLWGELPLLAPLHRRTALALAIPLIAWPGHWLTIIGTHCWFGAGTFLLLLSAHRHSCRSYAVRGGYLVLAGLTGVISCFMFPAYLLRAIREKSGEFCVYAGILLLSLLVHSGVLVHALLTHSPEISSRFVPNSILSLVLRTMVHLFSVPFTGRGLLEHEYSIALGSGIKAAFENISGSYLLLHDLFIVPLLVGMVVIMLTVTVILQNRSRLDVQLIAVSLLTVCIFSNLCSANMAGGPRYYFLPSLMLLTLYIGLAEMKSPRVMVAVSAALIVSTLLCNGYEFRSIMHQQAFNPGYPDWHAELKQWRMQPSREINIWPAPWKMALGRQERTAFD